MLDLPHRILGGGAEDPVHRQGPGDGGVGHGDPVEHHLGHLDLGAHVPQAEGGTGVGVLDVLNGSAGDDLQVLAIVAPEDLYRVVPLLGQVLAAPLGQAVAGGGGAVAEAGRQGLGKARAAEVVGKQGVHQLAHPVEDVPPLDELLVIGGGGGDVEVVALAGVKLGVHPVQGKGDLGQDVGPEGRDVPGGIDLAGGHVLDVVPEGDGDVLRLAVRGAQVDGDVGGDVGGNGDGHGSSFLTGPGGRSPPGPPAGRRPPPGGSGAGPGCW